MRPATAGYIGTQTFMGEAAAVVAGGGGGGAVAVHQHHAVVCRSAS
jgi:hypothetical protein